MSDVFKYFLLGMGPGGIYALLALGIVLVYRGSGVVNFGAGGFALLGSTLYLEAQEHELPAAVGIGMAVLAAAVLGVVVQILILHPMRAASPLGRVVATLGVTAAMELGAKWRYGTASRFVPSFLPTDGVEIAGVVVGADRLWIAAITAVLGVTLWLTYRWTTFGIATTAVAENPRATACLAWSPTRIAMLNWALGGALSGLAGALLVPILGFSPTSFTLLIVPALAVAVLARFRSFPVALLGGVIVGVLESEGTLLQSKHPENLLGVIPTFGLSSSVPFVVIIAVMVIRGHGLPLRGELTDRLPRLGTGVPRRGLVLVALGAVVASLFMFDTSWVASVSISATVALIGLSVVVVTGYAGQLSLAQYALAGVAALISSRLADAAGVPFLLAALVGVASTTLIGLLVALPAVRVRGVNLAVVTMALAVVISTAVLSNTDINGGAIRGTRVPDPSVFGIDVQATAHPERWAAVCLTALVLAAVLVSNLRRGRSGRRLIAVRNNERAAASLGVNVFVSKLYAFGVGAGLAGMGGVLLAFRNTSVDFGQFSPFQSILILLLTVIGGIGFIGGGVVAGAGVVGGAFEHAIGTFMEIDDLYRFVLALLFLVAIVIHPHGITEFVSHHLSPAFARLAHRRRPVSDADVPVPARITPVPPKALVVENMTVRFGGVTALDAVSFEVQPGEVLGLIGPNGAGKTTIVDAVTGFLAGHGGTVELDGVALTRLRPDQRASLGLTRSFQSLELFEDLSVADNLRVASDDGGLGHLVKDLLRVRRHELSPAAVAVIEEFRLADVLDWSPDDLSYAQRRSVAIARAVASNPSVLLLDEPAAGLDAVARQDLEHLIRRLAEEWQMAILLIEHDVALVMRTCDRVMALNFGVTLTTGTPDEVRRDEAVIRSYLGEEDRPIVKGVAAP